MDKALYDMVYKRKSFHFFVNVGNESLDEKEIEQIYDAYKDFCPLYKDIKTAIRIVKMNKRGSEYCILMYSEQKDNYLQNIGYLGEQLDLYLVSKNIGTLWYGIGKPDIKYYGDLDYVIMIAIHKVSDIDKYRQDMFQSKRKKIDEMWVGRQIEGVTNIVRFAPSACNSQPWLVKNEDSLLIYRYKKPGKRGIMPAKMVSFYNRIDMGIFLCFLDLCLIHENIRYRKELFVDRGGDNELVLNASYELLHD